PLSFTFFASLLSFPATVTSEIYTLSLHDALPIFERMGIVISIDDFGTGCSSFAYFRYFPIHIVKIDQSFIQNVTCDTTDAKITEDRKSTRLNSSHVKISYAVFCLKKKKTNIKKYP